MLIRLWDRTKWLRIICAVFLVVWHIQEATASTIEPACAKTHSCASGYAAGYRIGYDVLRTWPSGLLACMALIAFVVYLRRPENPAEAPNT
jgi:hypothetical protein